MCWVTRHQDTVQAGPAGPPTYPRWGSKAKRRDPVRGWTEEGSECAVQRLSAYSQLHSAA